MRFSLPRGLKSVSFICLLVLTNYMKGFNNEPNNLPIYGYLLLILAVLNHNNECLDIFFASFWFQMTFVADYQEGAHHDSVDSVCEVAGPVVELQGCQAVEGTDLGVVVVGHEGVERLQAVDVVAGEGSLHVFAVS